MRTILFRVFLSLILVAGASRAQEPAPPAPPATEPASDPSAAPTLEQRLEELDQQLRVLQRKDEIRQEAEAEKAKATPVVTAGKDGFNFRSPDGAFQVKLRGYVQLDGRFFQSDDQRPATDTFLLRRVRPIVEGTLYKIFDFRIMPDFGQGTSTLFDAYVDARFTNAFRVRAGKFKPPVGLERLQSATDTLFVERGFPTNLVPNRDLGVQVHGEAAKGAFAYAVGLFNGAADGANNDNDTNDGKDLAARVFVQPFLAGDGALKNLGFGVAASRGQQRGSLVATGLGAYRTPAQQTFFSYLTDGTAANTVVARGTRERLSPQATFYCGPFGLLGEYVTSKQEVQKGALRRELTNRSWQVAGSWVIAGGEASYRGVAPKKVFDPANYTWGAFELAGRLGRLEVDEESFPIFASLTGSAQAARSWALGLSWYLNRNLRVLLDYERTSFERGAATGDREDEKVLFSRFQVAF
jgi:phosphate-selective porin OprO/OprP